MSNSPQPFTDVELAQLATRPPTLHEPRDCIALVRRLIATAEHIVEGGGDLERSAPGGTALQTASGQACHRTKELAEVPPSRVHERSEAVEAAPPPRDVRPAPARAFTIESLDRIAAKLRALPPVDRSTRSLNKQEMVRRLAREIASLQRRGYTLEEVAESLRSSDVPITTPTLKSYLHRSKRSNATGSDRRRRRSIADTAASKGEPAASTADRQAPDLPRAEGPIDIWSGVFGSPVTTDREAEVVDDDDDPLWDLPDL
jgi:hypothetical protein